MCLWLITACIGLLPSNPTIIVVPGVPTPIILPTTVPTTAATNATTTTPRPTTPTTLAPTTAPPTMPTTAAPTTAAPTTAPPTMPTTASTAAPTTMTTRNGNSSKLMGNMTTSSTTTTTSLTIITNPSPSITALPTETPTNSPTPTEESLPVILCKDPDVICLFNPDENDAGSFPIDPRLGTTPSAALQSANPIIGYSAQISSLDSAVKFPRERRSVNHNRMKIKHPINTLLGARSALDHKIRKRQSCRCVPAGTCISSGAGMIDFRIVTPVNACPTGQVYCCGDTTAVTVGCGVLQAAPSPAVTLTAGQANFGEYPWQALVLTKQNDYIAGGVLIDQLNVLTVTHRMMAYVVSGTAPNVKVRLGEWDAGGTYETVPFQEYNVSKVFSHPSYNSNTLQYDIMVLRLSSTVPLTPMLGSTTTINRACLPRSSTATYTGLRCWVSGWGKDMFGLQGQYQNILKKVDVPIIEPATCQAQLQTARLGPTYVLDTTSFICAGGESSKDSCTGDGGSGLVCSINGQWVVVGLVAWGLGCASANIPAAYVNVAALLPWIQQQVATA